MYNNNEGHLFIQAYSNSGAVYIAEIISSISTLTSKIKYSEGNLNTSEYIFSSEGSMWRKGASDLTKTRLMLSSLDSLRYEGLYCYDLKAWKRLYLSREQIEIKLVIWKQKSLQLW